MAPVVAVCARNAVEKQNDSAMMPAKKPAQRETFIATSKVVVQTQL
jgi:hypothetical protein